VAEPAGKRPTLTLNRFATERLREAATLLSLQQDNPYRVAAYRRAADAVAALDRDLRDIVDGGGIEALEQIPGVGGGIAAALAEMIRTGRWIYLDRLRGSGEPEDVFCAVPGIGPELARRLHETLHVETLEQLEAALHEPDAKKVAGVGPRRLSMLRASLAQMLGRIRSVRTNPFDEPTVDVLLDVDREYRSKAEAQQLRKRSHPSVSTPRLRLGFLSCIRTVTNGISRHSSPTPRELTNSARSRIGLLSISMPTAAAKRSGPSSLKQGVFLPAIVWCAVANRSACHFTRKVHPGTSARDCLEDITDRLGSADDPFDAHQWPQARQRIAILSMSEVDHGRSAITPQHFGRA
jgi:hypothetical protein